MAKCAHDRVKSTCSVCSVESVHRQYQYKSKHRNLSFSLTLEEFESLINKPCHYCGESVEPRGLDRVDNRIGYINNGQIQNCVAACSECNFMKKDMLKHRFIDRAVKIAAYQQKLQKQKSELSNAA